MNELTSIHKKGEKKPEGCLFSSTEQETSINFSKQYSISHKNQKSISQKNRK